MGFFRSLLGPARLFHFEFESDLHDHPELAQRGPNGLERRDDLVGVGQFVELVRTARAILKNSPGSAGVAVFTWTVKMVYMGRFCASLSFLRLSHRILCRASILPGNCGSGLPFCRVLPSP